MGTKFVTIGQRIKHLGKTAWSGSSMDDLKAGWANTRNSFQTRKLATLFNGFTAVVGVASTGLSYYTCAFQQLGKLNAKENNFTKEIDEGKRKIEEFEDQVEAL